MQSDIFYAALKARDHRFDGKFFTCVKTTGIYCRPICPATPPKKENVVFHDSAIDAERAGYRPCLRCRPESAPLSPAWRGKTAIVNRALKFITRHSFKKESDEKFAERFGVTARHLRRLFKEEVGITPKQFYDSNRLGFSRKLVLETQLPILEIATTAGFRSLRRFNAAFKEKFQRSPRDLRKKKGIARKIPTVSLALSYRPPFDWNTLLSYFRRHQLEGIEEVGEYTYQRIFQLEGTIGKFQVGPHEEPQKLLLQIETENPEVLFSIVQRVRRMFDLDSDPLAISQYFYKQRVLRKLWGKSPGVRIPMGWDPFETAISTILGQLVSTLQAKTLVKQLIQSYGKPILRKSFEGKFLFPTPEEIARASLHELKTTQARKELLREFSRLVAEKKFELNSNLEDIFLKEKLLSVKGIGEWTAECIDLFSLGNPDAFPATDLILKRALAMHPELDMERMRPWRSYAAIYLWKEYAEQLSTIRKSNRENIP